MGRLSHDTHVHHFSHPHLLELANPQTLILTTPCSACKLQPSGWMYTCKPCNFTLHVSCTQMPQFITHPSHPSDHTLSLFPTPSYPGGLFNCDGCGRQGHGFSYHCAHCDFDLHIVCASRPLALAHRSHPHQLSLAFAPPYQTKGFSCDICMQLGSNHWLYRCNLCEFDAHVDCATNVQLHPRTQTHTQTRQAQQVHVDHIQHHNSFPTANHQMQYGMRPNDNRYVQTPAPGSGTSPLMDAMVQGLVQGAAEQVGQTIVQSLINGGGGRSADDCDLDPGTQN